MSKKICRGSSEYEDVAHFAIETFMYHERAQELVDNGRAMNFISGIMWRSFNSSTSAYHSLYRQKNKANDLTESHLHIIDTEYNYETDLVIEAIQGILEDMEAHQTDLWYKATLFQMWMVNPNYSELSRQTKIPRNSISHAVEEAKQYIKQQLKIQGIHYDNF